VYVVIVHPHMRLDTKDSRRVLPESILLRDHIQQSAYLAGFMSALYENDLDLLQASLKDCIVEPHRAKLIPGFAEVKNAAIDNGALGASLSGSGPSVFAFAKNKNDAEKIGIAMQQAFTKNNLTSDVYISPISSEGARLL
jgi:homoserine kinase